MAKLKIATLELVAPKSKQREITDYLQRTGAVEVSVPEKTATLTFEGFSEQLAEAQKQIKLLEEAQKILDGVCPQKKSLLSMLEPRRALSFEEYTALCENNAQTLQKARDIEEFYRQKEDEKAEIIRLNAQKATLLPWLGCDMPLKAGYTRSTAYLPGCVRKALTREDVLSFLAEKLPDNDCVEVLMASCDDETAFFTVFCLKNDVEEVEQALRELGFMNSPQLNGRSLQAQIEEYDEKINACSRHLAQIDEKLREYGNAYDEFAFCGDSLRLNASKFSAYEKIPGDERIFYLKGYIAQRDAKRLTKHLENDYFAAVEISEPGEDEDVPVLLTNNAFSAPLENITGMYSLPGKNDIDPTGVMAFFYYFFFGMMFSDAGYGLLMVLACGGVLLFKRNLEKKMKNTLRMYLYCGVSTVFWGAVYGSWFGDAPSVICREFLGKDGYTGFFSGIVNPTDDLMRVMIICFVFGLVHLFTGVVLKGITDIRNKQPREAFCNTLPPVLRVLGLAPVFFGMFIQDSMYTAENPGVFDGIFNALITGVAGLKTVSTCLLIAGVVLVVITGGRDSKSIGGKLAGGLYAVYNVFGGYLGDVLSYARLLALGLATGIVAQVMNMLGSMFGSGPVKVIAFVVIFTIGHLANFAINVIGAYVHTNRLQYVEFFGKFYEGGGRAFVPFTAETKYMKFKEEN